MTGYPWAAAVTNLLLTALAIAVVFGAALGVAVKLRGGRHDGIDVVWGAGFAVVALVTLVLAVGWGDLWRQLLITGLTVVWGVRLAVHIGRRNAGKAEDPRYVAIMNQAPGEPVAHLVRRVYLPQAVIMWVVSWPVQLGQYGHAAGLLPIVLTVLGVLSWTVGFVFESVGDAQLSWFRADPRNAGRVMDQGLWRYTRHPNYFGDAAVWWGLTLLALHHAAGLLGLVSAALMTWLLARGTARLLESTIGDRRPGYADYVRRTSGFVPLPPEEEEEGARMNVGDPVEDFELPDESGTPRRLSAMLRTGPVVLFFYPIASSGGCTQEVCHFRDLAGDFAAAGAQPVGVSSDDAAAQQRFAGANGLSYPLLTDAGHVVAKRFGAYRSWLPGGLHTRRRTFVIGRDGRLLGEVADERRFDRHADEALRILSAAS